jgi:hypothetical protein
MASLIDNCLFRAASSGTGSFVVSAAITGYQTPASASAIDGATYRYHAESDDKSQWEVGYGVYTVSSTTLARTTVLYNSSGGASAINFSAAPRVGIVALARDWREKLDAARTYYVRADGSDSNNGLANTSGGAFLTIQKAIDTVASIDMAAHQATIQVGAGTYTGALAMRNYLGALRPIIQGDTTTPSNVLVSTAGHCVSADGTLPWQLQGFRLTSSGGGCIRTYNAAALYIGAIEFHSASDAHIWAASASTIAVVSAYAITGSPSGGNQCHIISGDGSVFANTAYNVTIGSAQAFATAFALCARNGTLLNYTGTFTGAGVAGTTGPRYSANLNGVIYVGGAGANYFPGNSAGSTATGGQYA